MLRTDGSLLSSGRVLWNMRRSGLLRVLLQMMIQARIRTFIFERYWKRSTEQSWLHFILLFESLCKFILCCHDQTGEGFIVVFVTGSIERARSRGKNRPTAGIQLVLKCCYYIFLMDQLKFRESSIKKHDHEDTSQKKYGFKYYDYCDMVPNRHRIAESIIVNSTCEPKIKSATLRKSLNVNRKTKRSFNESHISISQIQNAQGAPSVASKNLKLGESKLNEELRYYKVICKNLRKQNSILKNQHQLLLKRRQSKKKKRENDKQNHIDSSRFQQLLKQLNAIEDQINKPQTSKKDSYKAFYVNFVKSLKELGIKEPLNQEGALRKWRQIIGFVQNNNVC